MVQKTEHGTNKILTHEKQVRLKKRHENRNFAMTYVTNNRLPICTGDKNLPKVTSTGIKECLLASDERPSDEVVSDDLSCKIASNRNIYP